MNLCASHFLIFMDAASSDRNFVTEIQRACDGLLCYHYSCFTYDISFSLNGIKRGRGSLI
jgi:hypothetical protein